MGCFFDEIGALDQRFGFAVLKVVGSRDAQEGQIALQRHPGRGGPQAML